MRKVIGVLKAEFDTLLSTVTKDTLITLFITVVSPTLSITYVKHLEILYLHLVLRSLCEAYAGCESKNFVGLLLVYLVEDVLRNGPYMQKI